jgi:hypothetical protein
MVEPPAAFERLLETLDRLEIQYAVGGSGASSVHGHWRATGDIDLVVRLNRGAVDPLVSELGQDFYIDKQMVLDCLERRRSFNVIHFQSAFKFDLFPLTDDVYQQEQFFRRRFQCAKLFGADPVEFAVISPEDSILSKLEWYRRGGEVSEQQWNDVLGVIAVQGERLDLAYMRRWADYLSISDLLEQALTEKH